MNTIYCNRCDQDQPALPQVQGRCVWCAHKAGLITGPQLADAERKGWAAGFPTLPHTFREDAVNK